MNRPTRGGGGLRIGRSSASSLTDSLRSVVRLRRAVSTHSKAVIRLSTESGDNAGKNMQNALRPARETSEHDRRRVPRRPRSGGRPPPPRTRSARRRRHRRRGAPTARRIAVRRVARRSRELRLPAEAAESAIENMVGSIQVPMGVAGPVSVDGGSVAGEVPPLATTEGALLASVNRGCSVINSAGG